MKSSHVTIITISCIALALVSACNNSAYSLEGQSLTSTCTSEEIRPTGTSKINWSHTFAGGIADISTNSSNLAVTVREIKAAAVTTSVSPPEISESLYVLRASDGQLLWQYPSEINSVKPNVIRGLSVNDKYVAIFFQFPDPKVLVFSVSTGKQVFEEPIDAFEILLANDNLFLRDATRTLLTYDLISGKLLSKQPSNNGRGERGLFYDGIDHVYSLFDGNVYLYDAHTGSMENEFPIAFAGGTGFFFEGAITDQHLLGSVGNELVYYDLVTGTKLWHNILSNSNGTEVNITRDLWPPAFSERFVFITTDNYKLYQVSFADGQIAPLSLPSMEDQVITSPLIIGGRLYSIFDDQTLKTLDLDSGQWSNVLGSGALRFPGNSAGLVFFYPKIKAVDSSQLFVSFGCQTLYAVAP